MLLYLLSCFSLGLLFLVVLLLIGTGYYRVNPASEFPRRKLLFPIVVVWGSCSLGGLLWRNDSTRTTYAERYSESNFQQITVGMSEQQVLALVGEPLEKWQPYRDNLNFPEQRQYVGFVYSKSQSKDDYELRQVNFDRGRVAEVRSYAYYD